MANVRFIRTTKEKWLKRDTYDPMALYFCEDSGEIFKGNILFTDGVRIVPTRNDLPSFSCAADGVVYYIADTKSGFMLSPTRDAWLQTIYAPVTDVTTIPDGEEYNVVTTVGAVRDIENEIYAYIDEQVTGEHGELDAIKEQIGVVPEGKTLLDLIDEKANSVDVYTKDEIHGLISGVYHYRGTVDTYADLPVEGRVVGDVWNIETADFEHGILPGDNVVWNGTSWDKLSGVVDLSGYVTTEQFAPIKDIIEQIPDKYLTKNQANITMEKVKYEITSKPIGTLVDYRDKEIRVMCPIDTKWEKQEVGNNGNPNMYYMTFKAYAPEGAVSFKEGDKGVIIDEMFTFDSSAAGIDEFGRKYSVCWLALASYDAISDTWNYYGKNSTIQKYVGWTYVVEWYDANGVVIESDSIRINLSNEDCYYNIEPYYVSSVSINNLVQDEDSILVLSGGTASL